MREHGDSLMRRFRAAGLGLGLLVLAGSIALAATTPNSIITPQTPNIGNQTFIGGTDVAGTYKTIYTGGANGSKCVAMFAASSDNAGSHLLTTEIVHGATTTPIATVTIPVSGTAHTYGTTLNVMAPGNWPGLPLDSDGNPYFYLANADTVKVTFATAINTTGGNDQINVAAVCADF